MRLLILTTSDKTLHWESLPKKIADIRRALPGFDVFVQFVHVTKPAVDSDGHINHQWLTALIKPYFNIGHDIVGLHMSDTQRKNWGIKPTLRGANPRSGGEYGDFYFWSNEHTLRSGLSQFVQTCLHEIGHEYHQQTKTPDGVHAAHDTNPDITPYMLTLDWSKYQPRRMRLKIQVSLLTKVVDLLKRLVALPPVEDTLLHPVEDFRNYVSQPYGAVNPDWYPLTGHHIGTDYATPKGTPVRAPWDGQVIASGRSDALGNFCIFEYSYGGKRYALRCLHLDAVPARVPLYRGEVIGRTGDSGRVTGPHLHLDVWHNEIRLDALTADNWRDKTVDPEKHFAT